MKSDEEYTVLLDAFATASQQLHEETDALIRRQWRSLTIAGVTVIAAVLLSVWAVFYFMGSPEHTEQTAALNKSSQNIRTLAFALADYSAAQNSAESIEAQQKLREEAKAAITACSTVHDRVLDSLNASDRQPKPESLSLTQLVGGTAVLAVLGYLGLMRLQNLDQELYNLRTFMFDQISARVKELKDTVRHDVLKEVANELRETVDRELSTTESEYERLRAESTSLSDRILATATATEEEINRSKQEALDQIQEIQNELERTLDKYPWLNNPKLREGLAQLDDIPSVEKAHKLATELAAKGDDSTAVTVLRTIAERHLPGDKDHFHNAHSQSMRLDNPEVALQIVDVGLESFPDDYDLMADKAIALNALGQPLEAQELLEDWRKRKPDEFARGWRPAVFYARVVEAGTLERKVQKNLIDTFENVLKRAPQERKVWSAYARFLCKIGRNEDAKAVLERGICLNRFSQELHFVLGDLLLRTGNAPEAVRELEMATRYDYQDQFQADVNPFAVLCMLAQAYEANDDTKQAIKLYKAVVQQGVHGSLLLYAQQRVHMVSALGGAPSSIPESPFPLGELTKILKEHNDHDESDS